MPDSQADRWRRADQVFEAALDLSPMQRPAYLDEACGDDAELRALVERLLASSEEETRSLHPGGALDNSLWGEVARELAGEPTEEESPSGRVIGRYRILEEIGRGGMAVVYLAERADGQFEQKVALKRIKRGVDTDEVVMRFDQERQILALARHPNIGQLLDGGVDDEGRPYFVMEHVEGRPIDDYCDERKLTIPERLRLFIQVARAVGYAHRNLVVHRDLKPSNILVSDEGVVKLLDFGIAKLLDSEAAPGATPLTRTHVRPMTPVYASPEQIQGEPVTTASDIYQLGLLLYEMLSGCYPYRLAERSPQEAVRAICETDPTRPSNAVLAAAGHAPPISGEKPPTSDAIGRARATSAERLRRELSGDLDNIVLMALRKEPERRYGSVAQLIEDIERYLDGRPVKARPNTFTYRTGKLVRRHRVAVATAAAALALIVTLVVFYTLRLTRERDRARVAAAEATQVADFLRSLFEISAPTRSLGEQVPARRLLDRGAERVDQDLAGQPEVQASMMTLMGEVYRELALFDEAEPLLERAVELQRSEGGNPDDLAHSLTSLAELRAGQGKYDEARKLVDQALALRREHLPADDPELGRTLWTLGRVAVSQGSYEEALEIQEQARRILETRAAPEDATPGLSWMSSGQALLALQRYDEAEETLRTALSSLEPGLGPDHPYVAEVRRLLGTALRHLGRDAEAEEQLRLALPALEHAYGTDHPKVADALDLLGGVLSSLDRMDEAIEARERSAAIYEAVYGPEHPVLAGVLNNLGRMYQKEHRYSEARDLYERSAKIFEASLGPEHPNALTPIRNLAGLAYQAGNLDEAARLFERVRRGYTKSFGPDTPYLVRPLYRLATIRMAQGDSTGAEPLLRRVLELGRNEGSSRYPEIVRPRVDLGRCLTQLGRYAEAEEILQLNIEEGDLDYGSALRTHEALAELYDRWGRPRDAALHRAEMETLRRENSEDDSQRREDSPEG